MTLLIQHVSRPKNKLYHDYINCFAFNLIFNSKRLIVTIDLTININREGRDVASDIISICLYALCTVKAVFGAGYERSHLDAVKVFPPQMPCNMNSVLYVMLV
jgi:hypothetical protein